MAAVTTVAIGVAGMAMSAYQAQQGAKQKKEAAEALKNLPVQDLTNPYEKLQVSTMGSDLKSEEQQRLESSQIEALQGSGVRGVVGGLGRVEAGSQAVANQNAADLDAQRKAIDQAVAGDETAIRTMEEQRRRENVAALSSQFSAGQQQQWQGLQGAFQSAAAGASGYAQIKGMQPTVDGGREQLIAASDGINQAGVNTAGSAILQAGLPLSGYKSVSSSMFMPNQPISTSTVPSIKGALYNQQYVK